ncbi:hypothetical protein BWI93_04055 [Siphonobacter sp. BAB-5385]|uniref:hypothetical protein n=1 Tax=Siphonobacter sp. BAB-5385 TaxID=1864822 RepID=UPI000B9E0830|nr:hypothetical protein [Siphonobacter sp. BAB-5385]OZI09342.1 hypothetical protein BWI93_04055 [Siphonobacter sp. BAB-5385]
MEKELRDLLILSFIGVTLGALVNLFVVSEDQAYQTNRSLLKEFALSYAVGYYAGFIIYVLSWKQSIIIITAASFSLMGSKGARLAKSMTWAKMKAEIQRVFFSKTE